MDNIEEDKVANKVLEDLPPSFMVFGTKKPQDTLEEFWMNKLTNIEQQYDQHIVELERKLLRQRASRRSIRNQAAKIDKLKEDLAEKTTEIQGFKSKTGALKEKLKEKEYETKSIHEKFERATTAYRNVTKQMQDERQARMRYEKECNDLKNRLKALERDRAQLLVDVDIKESEKARVEERESHLHAERWSFIQRLTDTDTERRIQTNANLQLCQDIEKLLNVEKSLEGNLLRERQIMRDMMGEMKYQREQHQKALRQLDLTIKEKRDVQESYDFTLKKSRDLERDVRHWKEEHKFKEIDNSTQNQEIKDLKRRNSQIRCLLADTKHKLNTCMSEMQSLENERRRANIELQSAKRQEKALQLEIKKNELRKYKLAERILKAHPNLFQNREEGNEQGRSRDVLKSKSTSEKEIESYKKSIWKIGKHKDEVERKLRELQRKENIYRMKLEKFSSLEKEIFWTGKAMAKLEGDRNRLESLLKTMESNMPIKVPFKKLVTDPSVLDRLAKNKVLQKRIFQQAEKIEELKSNARRILKFREEDFGAMSRQQEEIPIWKLEYWNKSSVTPDNILSGLIIDVKRGSGGATGHPSLFADENHYSNYLHHLNEEIPKLKQELEHLERKKMHNELERENEESHKKKLEAVALERKKMTEMLLNDEQLPVEPITHESEGEEDDGGDAQCTPDVSMHGSDYEHGKGDDETAVSKASKVQKQSAARMASSSTEDERDDMSSGDACSEIPSDKSK